MSLNLNIQGRLENSENSSFCMIHENAMNEVEGIGGGGRRSNMTQSLENFISSENQKNTTLFSMFSLEFDFYLCVTLIEKKKLS